MQWLLMVIHLENLVSGIVKALNLNLYVLPARLQGTVGFHVLICQCSTSEVFKFGLQPMSLAI